MGKTNFEKYIHKYINSRLNINVKEVDAPEESIPLCAELLHASYDHFAIQDEQRLGEDKEFSELWRAIFFNDKTVTFEPEFIKIDWRNSLHGLPDNPYLAEAVTVFNGNGDWNPIDNIAKIYFEETKTIYEVVFKEAEEGLQQEIDCIRIKADSPDINAMLIIDSENQIRFIGNHSYYNKNIIHLYDFLLLMKFNLYNI